MGGTELSGGAAKFGSDRLDSEAGIGQRLKRVASSVAGQRVYPFANVIDLRELDRVDAAVSLEQEALDLRPARAMVP